jgi:hypothetical protein
MVGLPGKKPTLNHFAVVNKCWVVSGSTIGNTDMAQDMLNFCGEKNITADVEVRAENRCLPFQRGVTARRVCGTTVRTLGTVHVWDLTETVQLVSD